MDGEINADDYSDLTLYEVDLDHKLGALLRALPQTGEPQTWYIIAGIPEPAVAQVGGLALAAAWILQRLRPR
jgi:LPXTG-motif cell wall-anchored protein